MDPRVLERALPQLPRLLLELLSPPLVNASALVDQVARRRLLRVDVADDTDVDMGLLLGHTTQPKSFQSWGLTGGFV